MFAGATNDNLVKTAFVVAITALSWDIFAFDAVILANAAALCFILPFVFLAGFSAYQANVQPPKRWLMTLKIIELGLAIISGCAIYYEIGWLLLLCIAGFGVQSALIGPLKYALIPRLTEESKLLDKNAWMESATFVAILVGTLVASDWIIDAHAQLITLTIILASAGIAGVLPLPMFDGQPGNAQYSIKDLVHKQRHDLRSMSAIWCISGFWGVGSVWLTHLPMLAVDVWGLSPQSIGTLLGYFVLGITLGAFAGVLLKDRQLVIRIIAGSSTMVLGSLILQGGYHETAASGPGFIRAFCRCDLIAVNSPSIRALATLDQRPQPVPAVETQGVHVFEDLRGLEDHALAEHQQCTLAYLGTGHPTRSRFAVSGHLATHALAVDVDRTVAEDQFQFGVAGSVLQTAGVFGDLLLVSFDLLEVGVGRIETELTT